MEKIKAEFSNTYPDAVKITHVQWFSLVNISIWLMFNCIVIGVNPSFSLKLVSSVPM